MKPMTASAAPARPQGDETEPLEGIDLQALWARLRPRLRPTLILPAERLGAELGCELYLACETHQHTGSFKYRAASSVALSVPHPIVVTASSGNFGQAMAAACTAAGKRAVVVMPTTSARVKVEAVRAYGGEVVFVDTRETTRAARLAEVAAAHPEAYVASAYDNPWVIAGNSTLGEELAHSGEPFSRVVAPVGGGGLTSGLLLGLRRGGSAVELWGAEPALANDAARSLRAGRLLANEGEPATLADGARTPSLGRSNWEILHGGLAGILEVPEDAIAEGVRLLFSAANLKAEPTGALAIGALLAHPDSFRNHRTLCVISGGNVDSDLYCELLQSRRGTP